MIKYIDNENFKSEVLNAKLPVIVDFFATWCGPCSMLSPILEQVANDTTDFDIAKVDVDKLADLSIEYGIEVVPTLLIFKNGKIVDRIEGVIQKDEIINRMANI